MDQDDKYVLAYRTYSLSRAEVIECMMRAYAIPALLIDRHFNSTNGHIAFATGGYRIMVLESRLRDAQELLKPFKDAEGSVEREAFRMRVPSRALRLKIIQMFSTWVPGWLRGKRR